MIRRLLLAAAPFLAAACGQGSPPKPAIAFDGAQASGAAERVAHGRRLASVLGCRGCHGDTLEGEPFFGIPAANLTRDVARYSDAGLERVLRAGERNDGRDLWSMPSELFQHLSEPDMAALIAYLRTLRPRGAPTPPLNDAMRASIAEARLKPAAQLVREERTLLPADLGPAHARARYIATVTCAECHGPRLGGDGEGSPDLTVVAGYDRAAFERLMTQGVPTGGRTLGLMAQTARGRFSRMTRAERDDLYAYLRARAEARRRH